MDKSYAAICGKPPFDWNKFLDDRLAGVPITDVEYREARDLAVEWVSCACGNQCAIIPRGQSGMPIDREMAYRGGLFSAMISTKTWGEAKLTLFLIEKRSEELIREELAKLNS